MTNGLVLKAAAICLHYPGPSLAPRLAALAEALPDLPRAARQRFSRFLADVRGLDPVAWESRYTATFDFRKEHALYLTFHECGETPQRGAALVALAEQIRAAGYGYPEDELPDFVPLLLELVAVAPPAALAGDLPVRLARVLQQIARGLAASDGLYLPVCEAALAALPKPAGLPGPEGPGFQAGGPEGPGFQAGGPEGPGFRAGGPEGPGFQAGESEGPAVLSGPAPGACRSTQTEPNGVMA